MKYVVFVLIFSITLPGLTLASEERGLQLMTIKDQSGQEIDLYEESHALIIGVSDYTEGWPDLPGVKKDVQAVKVALEEHGFHVVVEANPNRTQLEQAFTDFINRYGQQPGNRLVFYFAGHGHTLTLAYGGEMGYIVPTDAPNPHREKPRFLATARDMQMIEVYARRIQAKHALFLFDSCFSGSIFALSRAAPDSITYKTARPVRQFLTSGSAEEQVPDESIFRQQFIAALQGEGDVNGDGYITGAELGEFLQNTVVNYSKGAQHPQYGKIRDPHLDKGDFVFQLNIQVDLTIVPTSVVPASAPSGDPEAEMWEFVKHSTDISDVNDFLAAFPQGRFSKVAQLKLKQLERQQRPKEHPATPTVPTVTPIEIREQPTPAIAIPSDNCFEQSFHGVPEDRVITLEEGAREVILIKQQQSKDEAIALRFTENAEPIGALTFKFFSSGVIFKVVTLIDTTCRQVEHSNADRPGERALQNWDTMHIRFDDQTYALRLGYNTDSGEIEALHFRRISPLPTPMVAIPSDDCFEQYFHDIPEDRVLSLEEGAREEILIRPEQPKNETIGVRFTENGEPIGALTFKFFSSGAIFKIVTLIDTTCLQVEHTNADRPGERALQNWDTMHIRFGDQTYALRLGYNTDSGEIEALHFRKISDL